MMRTEDVGGAPVLVPKGGGDLLVVAEFAHVGPEVDATRAGLELALGGVVPPPPARAVSGGGEPALVAAQDFAGQGRTVDAPGRRPVVGAHGGDHFVTTRLRVRPWGC